MAILMARRPGMPKKGVKPLSVELAEELSLDLVAFCRANYNAPQIEVIREAIREHIDRRLQSEPALRQRFLQAREELRKQAAEPLRLVDKGSKPSSEGPVEGSEPSEIIVRPPC